MKNLFENAKFGDIYVSKDGTKHTFCSFTTSGNDTLVRLYREQWGVVLSYLDGTIHPDNADFNIKERCGSLIDKACEVYSKELKEIIDTFNTLGKQLYNIDELGELISLEGSVKDFRKALEE